MTPPAIPAFPDPLPRGHRAPNLHHHPEVHQIENRAGDPGLAEVERVLRPGGAIFVIDNDWDHGTFGGWLRRSPWAEGYDPEATRRFWAERGFGSRLIESDWRFDSREDLEAVVRIEFP